MPLIKLAGEYRAERAGAGRARTGGVVVIYSARVTGRMDALRDPQHWQPGCYAVTCEGDVYEAVGGDDYNGAQQWINVTPRGYEA